MLKVQHDAAVQALIANRSEAAQMVEAKRQPLMLPAPVETIEISGMTAVDAINEIAAIRATLRNSV